VGETATTTVSYTISDGQGGTDTATITVTVTGVNDAPEVVVGSEVPDQSGNDGEADHAGGRDGRVHGCGR
jgi:large repetitive protein